MLFDEFGQFFVMFCSWTGWLLVVGRSKGQRQSKAILASHTLLYFYMLHWNDLMDCCFFGIQAAFWLCSNINQVEYKQIISWFHLSYWKIDEINCASLLWLVRGYRHTVHTAQDACWFSKRNFKFIINVESNYAFDITSWFYLLIHFNDLDEVFCFLLDLLWIYWWPENFVVRHRWLLPQPYESIPSCSWWYHSTLTEIWLILVNKKDFACRNQMNSTPSAQ